MDPDVGWDFVRKGPYTERVCSERSGPYAGLDFASMGPYAEQSSAWQDPCIELDSAEMNPWAARDCACVDLGGFPSLRFAALADFARGNFVSALHARLPPPAASARSTLGLRVPCMNHVDWMAGNSRGGWDCMTCVEAN